VDQEQVQKLERVISKERLGGYRTKRAAQYDCTDLDLYRWNTLLSESLYCLLQTIEITFRNALYVSIAEHFNDKNWLFNSKILEPRDFIEVKKQEERLLKSGKPVSAGSLIAELNFGFWTGLLDARYEMKFWRSKIIKKVFPNMAPQSRTRHHLSRCFNKIRKLRNRVFHFEPIWYWQDLKEQHKAIWMAIDWIEPIALELCKGDRFLEIYCRSSKTFGW
jgi:hypothetical protein